MKTFAELNKAVVALQERIKPVNHMLENPSVCAKSRKILNCELARLKAEWFDATCDLHAHPDYSGSFAFIKENNPYRG